MKQFDKKSRGDYGMETTILVKYPIFERHRLSFIRVLQITHKAKKIYNFKFERECGIKHDTITA